MKFTKFVFPLLFAFFALLLQGCGNAAPSEEMGQKMVDRFHQQLSQKEYVGIYRTANISFKQSMNEEQFVEFISEAHAKMGEFKNSELLNVIKKNALGKSRPTLFMTYKSNYSNYLVEELFIFEESDSGIGFAGYKYTLFEGGGKV